jgi:cation:H+ antiporter
VAFGNVVGSNIANIPLLLGITALVASPPRVNTAITWLDTPIMTGVSALLVYLSFDGVLSQRDGLILLASLAAYILIRLLQSRSGSMKGQTASSLRDGTPSAAA